MQSREHALVSMLVGAMGVWTLSLPVADPVALLYATVLGVAIDLDHFVLARLRTGDWEAVRRCLREPRIALVDQEEIFPDGVVGPQRRLLSHVLLGGFLVGVLWEVSVGLAALTALVLYAHVVSDLIWDVTRGAFAEPHPLDHRPEPDEASN